jgi:hypothetical protein
MSQELVIPPAAASDPAALELLRVWTANGSQHVSIATGVWSDPAAWGMMLVDLVKHIANAYAQSEGRESSQVITRIRAGFDAEWSTPTDNPAGGILGS